MFYIPQTTKCSCGMACLKMLLANVHNDENYLYLPENERHGPYSYQHLVTLAQRYDVTLLGVKYEDKEDLRHVKTFPMILTVINPNDSPHAVLVTKRRNRFIQVFDPDSGVRWQKIDSFIVDWDGTALAVNHVEKQKYNKIVVDVSDGKNKILAYILQILAAVFITLATLFLKPDGPYYLPIIFCALSGLSEILLRFHLLKTMQKCDKYLRRFIPYVDKRDYLEFYRRCQEYKRSALTMGLNFIFNILLIILVAVVLLINSLSNVIFIFVALLSACIDVFLFNPLTKDIAKQVADEEDEIKTIRDDQEMDLQVKSLEVKSYRYAYLLFAKKIVVGAFFLLSSILVCLYTHAFALTNVVFYACVTMLIYNYLIPLLSYENRALENKVNKVRLNNIVHPTDEINRK